jgi:WD40 repeat protein
MHGHLDRVMSVSFSPDGSHIASGSIDQTVRIWDAKTGAHLSTLEGHSDWVLSVAFSPDGSRVAGSGNKTVRIWDATSGAHLSTFKGRSDSVRSLAFSPDGKCILSSDYGGTEHAWDISQYVGNNVLAEPLPPPTTCNISLESSSGWFTVRLNKVRTRVWLPAGPKPVHSVHKSFVVVGTDEGVVILLTVPDNIPVNP